MNVIRDLGSDIMMRIIERTMQRKKDVVARNKTLESGKSVSGGKEIKPRCSIEELSMTQQTSHTLENLCCLTLKAAFVSSSSGVFVFSAFENQQLQLQGGPKRSTQFVATIVTQVPEGNLGFIDCDLK
tara:strand:- start:419 stop:802 length:384 start_codon:yes stop_codon:yes gene_type:complete